MAYIQEVRAKIREVEKRSDAVEARGLDDTGVMALYTTLRQEVTALRQLEVTLTKAPEIEPHRDDVRARDQHDQIIHISAVVDKLAMAKTNQASTADDVETLGVRLARWLNGVIDLHEKKSI